MRPTFALTVLLLLAAPADATRTSPVDVRCPACDREFTAQRAASSNSLCGSDYDLCAWAMGEEARNYAVWTCPRCAFSRTAGRFRDPVEPDVAKRVREELLLPEDLGPIPDQMSIPAWLKVRFALKIAEWEGAPAPERLGLARTGAWTSRETFAIGPPPGRSEAVYDRAYAETAGGLSGFHPRAALIRGAELWLEMARERADDPIEAARRVLYAAVWLRSTGEDRRIQPELRRIAEDEAMPEWAQRNARELMAGAARERAFRQVFLALAPQVIEDRETTLEARAILLYQRADFLRRDGRDAAALDAYRAAIAHPGAPWWLGPLFVEALARTGGPELPPAERDATIAGARNGALARLALPESAGEGRRMLAELADPRAIPGLVALLGRVEAPVRVAAAGALADYDDPGPDAVDELIKCGADPQIARELARIASPRSRAFFEAALEDESGDAETAIRALGRCGDSGSVPLVRARLAEFPTAATSALSLLANRPFGSADSFDAWWIEHGGESRETWVDRGFVEAGVDGADTAALVEALADDRPFVRFNAFRRLRERTGHAFGRDVFVETPFYPRGPAAREAIGRFRLALGK